jgi:hypothetical protein
METEKIKLSELLAMDMGQLSDWMISRSGSYDTVTLSPQAASEAVSAELALLCCKEWAYYYMMTNNRPDDKTIKYLDDLGLIKSNAPVGQYGWLADNPQNWAMIAAKILVAT